MMSVLNYKSFNTLLYYFTKYECHQTTDGLMQVLWLTMEHKMVYYHVWNVWVWSSLLLTILAT